MTKSQHTLTGLKININKNAKFIFISIFGIGNHVMLTPVYTNIKKNFPESEIYVLCLGSSAQILENNKNVDKVIIYPDNPNLIQKFWFWLSLRKYKFDIGYYPFPNLGINCILALFFIGAKNKLNYSYDFLWLKNISWLNSTKIKLDRNIHDAEKNLNLLKELPIKIYTDEYYVPYSKEDQSFVHSLIKENSLENKTLVAVHVGSKDPSKNWHFDNFLEVINRILKDFPVKIVLIGSKSEREILKGHPLENTNIVDLIGTTSLTQTAALLKNCSLIISNDSGPMHLAVTVKTRVIGIFLIDTVRRTNPRGKDDIVFTLNKFKLGIDKNKNHIYSDAITPDLVYPYVKKELIKITNNGKKS